MSDTAETPAQLLGSDELGWPVVDPTAFVAPNAVLVGDVRVGADASIWYGATLRADCGTITVGRGSNIQDSCSLHPTFDNPVTIGDGVSIGHNAVVHGCTIGDQVLIGMGAIVMNHAVIGPGSIVAAGALVSEGKVFGPNSLIVGSPATARRETTAGEREANRKNSDWYVANARRHAQARPARERTES